MTQLGFGEQPFFDANVWDRPPPPLLGKDPPKNPNMVIPTPLYVPHDYFYKGVPELKRRRDIPKQRYGSGMPEVIPPPLKRQRAFEEAPVNENYDEDEYDDAYDIVTTELGSVRFPSDTNNVADPHRTASWLLDAIISNVKSAANYARRAPLPGPKTWRKRVVQYQPPPSKW